MLTCFYRINNNKKKTQNTKTNNVTNLIPRLHVHHYSKVDDLFRNYSALKTMLAVKAERLERDIYIFHLCWIGARGK